MDEPRHLFVYGTLRRRSSHCMARVLQTRAIFIDSARMPGRLFDLGRYPGMVEADGAEEWVMGDLYELPPDTDLLRDLDRYEGADGTQSALFDRQPGEALLPNGRLVDAWWYRYRGSRFDAQRIVSGDYFT
jgi:gamma-glutamylcyclotransferase (GGCT)/AIG2-like uncharacterized protein YtfP